MKRQNVLRSSTSQSDATDETLRLLLDDHPLPIWVYDLETLAFLEANHAAVGKYGFTRKQFLTMTLKDICPLEDVARLLDHVAKLPLELQHSGEWRHTLKDGRIIDVEATSHTLAYHGCKAALVIVRDLTERKQAEEEIRGRNAELESRLAKRTAQLERAKMELEAFSYSVSHDLRAPLQHANEYVNLLIKESQSRLSEKGQHYLTSIANSVHQLGTLFQDLVQFYRTDRTEMRPSNVDMNEVVEEVVESLRHDNSGHTIEWIVGKLPSVSCNKAMLKLVWMNLLSNAVKYSRAREKPRIELGVYEEKSEFVFYVRDNGVGFDMQYAQKLFGAFQRLHSPEEFEGNGMGLANVRRIISRHQGRTWAEAELEKGATFYFTLPNN
jgi:PAS domain S-box-containing protein